MGYAIGPIWPVGRSLMTRVLFYEYTITYIYFVSSLQSKLLSFDRPEGGCVIVAQCGFSIF